MPVRVYISIHLFIFHVCFIYAYVHKYIFFVFLSSYVFAFLRFCLAQNVLAVKTAANCEHFFPQVTEISIKRTNVCASVWLCMCVCVYVWFYLLACLPACLPAFLFACLCNLCLFISI